MKKFGENSCISIMNCSNFTHIQREKKYLGDICNKLSDLGKHPNENSDCFFRHKELRSACACNFSIRVEIGR